MNEVSFMTNEEVQTDDIARIIRTSYSLSPCTSDAAKAIYNAGYRKADEVQKETAKEILQYVGDLYDDCDQRFRLKDYQWHKNLCKKYGVEVEK